MEQLTMLLTTFVRILLRDVTIALFALFGFFLTSLLGATPAAAAQQPAPKPVVMLAAYESPVPMAPVVEVMAATPAGSTHAVRKGEVLSTIAMAKGCPTWKVLHQANPQVSNPHAIRIGQVLNIPGSCGQASPSQAASSAPPPAAVDSAPAASSSKYPRRDVDDSIWDRLAICESTSNWKINNGNGYYGGLQFSRTTWLEFGGAEFASRAHKATRLEQIIVAERVLYVQGWKAWPTCSRRQGLR